MQIKTQERIVGGQGQKRTFVDPNPRKEKEMLDRDGNVIDPRTKQIIKKVEDNK
jgi:hypothetical protein